MIDITCLAVFGVVTYLVAAEGAWGAATTLVAVILSGVLAMNWFEPLADFLTASVSNSPSMAPRWDIVALLGLFAAGIAGARFAVEKMQPTDLPVESKTYDILRWTCGLGTGYVVMAVLLTSLHVAPLNPGAMGFQPERDNVFGDAPDRRWLGHVQYLSENPFATYDSGVKVVFDGPSYSLLPGAQSYRWSSMPMRYHTRRLVQSGLIAPRRSTTTPGRGSRPRSRAAF